METLVTLCDTFFFLWNVVTWSRVCLPSYFGRLDDLPEKPQHPDGPVVSLGEPHNPDGPGVRLEVVGTGVAYT